MLALGFECGYLRLEIVDAVGERAFLAVSAQLLLAYVGVFLFEVVAFGLERVDFVA